MGKKTDFADLEIWGLEGQGEGRSLINHLKCKKYSLLFLAPENLSLIAQKDKDTWQMLKVQSFLEEFFPGEILGLKEYNIFSRMSHSCSLL